MTSKNRLVRGGQRAGGVRSREGSIASGSGRSEDLALHRDGTERTSYLYVGSWDKDRERTGQEE